MRPGRKRDDMSTANDMDLAKRAVACPAWRWMPGMLILTISGVTDRVAGIDSTYIHAWAESQQKENPRGLWLRYRRDRMDKHGVPDLTDPATLGCLLALVREAWGLRIVAIPLAQGIEWHALRDHNTGNGLVVGSGNTEAEALVSALESAP